MVPLNELRTMLKSFSSVEIDFCSLDQVAIDLQHNHDARDSLLSEIEASLKLTRADFAALRLSFEHKQDNAQSMKTQFETIKAEAAK